MMRNAGRLALVVMVACGPSSRDRVAYFKGKVYGFTNGGQFVLIDPNTGTAMSVSQTNIQWWGAAVTTIAPVLQ